MACCKSLLIHQREVFVRNVPYNSLQLLLIISLDEDDEIIYSASDIKNYVIDK